MNPQHEMMIFSIWPEDVIVTRPWQRYVIPGGSPQAPGQCLITRAITARKYIGRGQYTDFHEGADIIAADLVHSAAKTGPVHVDGVAEMGIWAEAAETPSADRIIHYLQLQDEYLRRWVAAGDRLAEENKISAIHSMSRKAARWLKVDRPWCRIVATTDTKRCPFCASLIPVSAAVCPICKEVVDRDRYAALAGAKQPLPPPPAPSKAPQPAPR